MKIDVPPAAAIFWLWVITVSTRVAVLTMVSLLRVAYFALQLEDESVCYFTGPVVKYINRSFGHFF